MKGDALSELRREAQFQVVDDWILAVFGEEAAWVRPPEDAHGRLVWVVARPRLVSIEILEPVFIDQSAQLKHFLIDATRVLEAYPTAYRLEISETRARAIIESV